MKTRPYWSNFFLLLLTLVSLVFSSCSFVGGSETGIKSEVLRISFKNTDWKSIEADQADHAYQHKKNKSIILVNSLCRKYDRTSLKQLTDNLLAGLQNSHVLQQNPSMLFKRASLRTKATGKLDGVATSMLIEVVKRDRCIYDFALISTESDISENLESGFNSLLNAAHLESE